VATIILVVLTTMALPLARLSIKREKEKELRYDLWQMRDAIDRYKDWGGDNVFDVFSKSEGTALDGTKYKDW